MKPPRSIATKKEKTTKPVPSARPTPGPQHTVTSAKAPATRLQPDVISLLRADHKKMRELLTELQSAAKPSQRERLLTQVKKELETHMKIEEELFYPAFSAAAKTKKDEQLVHEATAEHHAAKLILGEVGSADDTTEQFRGRAKVLKEIVEHHASEEETDMFPRARELLGVAESRTLGQQMAERKRALVHRDPGGTSTLRKVADFVASSFSGPSKAPLEARA